MASKKQVEAATEEEVETFGNSKKGEPQFYYDHWAFLYWKCPLEERLRIFKRMADVMVPGWFEWHEWTERIIRAGCHAHRTKESEPNWLGATGCSNSSKTRNIVGFACTWWALDPENSSVTLFSTTGKATRKRAWNEVQSYKWKLDEFSELGRLVDYKTMWQYQPSDDKHAIFVKAVDQGDVAKAAADIQGHHTKRQMIIVDEAEAAPPAIWTSAGNLWAYPIDVGGEFIFIAAANARSRLSRFGRFIEPENGWSSVSIETEEWFSKPQLDGSRAKVLRFDFRKSPNITAGRTVSKHIPSKQRVLQRMAYLKKIGADNDPEHYCYDLGFPVPEGLTKTVFSETFLERFRCYDRHQFSGPNFTIIGVLDPAYGGDRPALRFAAIGTIAGNIMGIEVMEPIILYVDVTDPTPVRYQLLRQMREHCRNVNYRGQKHECDPKDFGIDCTGDGGLADIAQEEWSRDIIRINFSSSASETPCSDADPRPACDVYLNKRVEMYFQTFNACKSGQIKGLDKDTAAELCTIEESTLKPDGTTRTKKTLQSKKDYKLKFTKSPDLADSFCMIPEVARRKGFTIVSIGLTVQVDKEMEEMMKKTQAVYDPDTMYQPEEEPEDEYV